MPIVTNNEKIDLSSEDQTKGLANNIIKKLRLKDGIFLYGEIGVGKTTFTRYLINELQKNNNVKLTEVTSPTFSLLNEYKINEIRIKHYDLFRVKSKEELKNLDLFNKKDETITFVEWPQIIESRPKKLIEFFFNYENNYRSRSLIIKGLDI